MYPFRNRITSLQNRLCQLRVEIEAYVRNFAPRFIVNGDRSACRAIPCAIICAYAVQKLMCAIVHGIIIAQNDCKARTAIFLHDHTPCLKLRFLLVTDTFVLRKGNQERISRSRAIYLCALEETQCRYT